MCYLWQVLRKAVLMSGVAAKQLKECIIGNKRKQSFFTSLLILLCKSAQMHPHASTS